VGSGCYPIGGAGGQGCEIVGALLWLLLQGWHAWPVSASSRARSSSLPVQVPVQYSTVHYGLSSELVFTKLIWQILYWIYEIAIHSRIFILDLPIEMWNYIETWNLFWREIGSFLVCLTVEKNLGAPQNYRFMMDYEYQEKKKEFYQLKYKVFTIYILSIRFHKIFFVCQYQLWYRRKQFRFYCKKF
jgi:hypothetical protein